MHACIILENYILHVLWHATKERDHSIMMIHFIIYNAVRRERGSNTMYDMRVTTVAHRFNCGEARKRCHAYSERVEFRGEFIERYLRPDNATEVALFADASVATMRQHHLTLALQHARYREKGALFLEFGVQQGDGINHLAAQNASLWWHGFDSFLGMPLDRRDEERARRKPLSWKKGGYTQRGRVPKVARNARLHAGWFNETVPRFLDGIQVSGALELDALHLCATKI
jgi:hypothetical protein